MNFIDLNRSDIKRNSIIIDKFYEYTIGSPIEVTCLKNANSNKLISSNLSSDKLEDKFMIRYRPNNKVYFLKDYIDSDEETDFSSIWIDKDENRVYVGRSGDYKLNDGVLVFSGFFSMNNILESDRYIYGNSRVIETIKQRVYILSVGVRDNMLYALYYIASHKGTAIGIKDSNYKGLSINTLKECNCTKYNKFTIKDWFDGAKIEEL